jgi:RimJ/RimL family protein N-acetyltransferase
MIVFERTYDYELVRRIVTHPRVYRAAVLPDHAPSAENYRVAGEASTWHVIAHDAAGRALGLFLFVPRSPIWSDAHMCLLPAAWGKGSAALCIACAQWFGRASGCRCLTATVPVFNPPMLALAERIGMQHVGVLPHSVLHGGLLRDQSVFSLSL